MIKKTEFKFGYAVNGVKFISISESFVELPYSFIKLNVCHIAGKHIADEVIEKWRSDSSASNSPFSALQVWQFDFKKLDCDTKIALL